MDVLRRNTDYALRIMVNLARHSNGELLSARLLAKQGNFSYQLGAKLLQKLVKANLVSSVMGAKGGFKLNKDPSKITIMEIIKLFQDGIRLNRCLPGGDGCEFKPDCELSTKLACLQLYIDGYLGGITLEEICRSQKRRKRKK
jgi:Rrf2 family protein